MDSLIHTVKDHPARVVALVQTVLTLLTTFGVDLTAEQVASILGVTGTVLSLFLAQYVYTPKTHNREVSRAFVDGQAFAQGVDGFD